MEKIKKGDIVGRISYGKDIVFYVKRIITQKNGKKIALLKGVTERIEADSNIDDLYLMDKEQLEEELERFDRNVILRIANRERKNKNLKIASGEPKNNRVLSNCITGKILHLDR